jgi:hypothetical protein
MNRIFASEKMIVDESVQAINNLFIEKGWSDGLPIIPPTEEAVGLMLMVTSSILFCQYN